MADKVAMLNKGYTTLRATLLEDSWEEIEENSSWGEEGQAAFSLYNVMFLILVKVSGGKQIEVTLSTADTGGKLAQLQERVLRPVSLDGDKVIFIDRQDNANSPESLAKEIGRYSLSRFRSYLKEIENKIQTLENLKERREKIGKVVEQMEERLDMNHQDETEEEILLEDRAFEE